jgi:hypothetical protein
MARYYIVSESHRVPGTYIALKRVGGRGDGYWTSSPKEARVFEEKAHASNHIAGNLRFNKPRVVDFDELHELLGLQAKQARPVEDEYDKLVTAGSPNRPTELHT